MRKTVVLYLGLVVAALMLSTTLPTAAQASSWAAPIAGPTAANLSTVVLSDDGTITGVWFEGPTPLACDSDEPDPGCEVRAARLTATGWSTPVTISTGDAHARSGAVRLAVDARGTVTALWTTAGWNQADGEAIGDAAWASRFTDGTWSPARQLSASDLHIYYLALTVADNGTVVAAWNDDRTGDVQAAHFGDGAWSTAVAIPDGTQAADYIDALVASPDGSFTILTRRTSADRIGAARLADGVWTDEGLITPTGRAAYNGRAVVTSDGSLTAVWDSMVSGSYAIESARRINGIWQSPVLVSDTADNEYVGGLAADEHGDVLLVWSEYSGSSGNPLRPQFAVLRDGTWSSRAPIVSVSDPADIDSLIDTGGTPLLVLSTNDGGGWSSRSTRFADNSWSTATPLVAGAVWRAFQVTANAAGGAVARGTGSTVMRYGTAPPPPTGTRGEGGDRSITAHWTSPVRLSAPITRYTATAEPGGAFCTTAATTCTITGLDHATTYRISVAATNAFGSGAASAASDPVTTSAATSAPRPRIGRITVAAGGTTLRIPVTVPGPGRVIVTGTTPARARGRAVVRQVRRCTVRATFARAGSRALRCKLRGDVRRLLARGSLRFTFRVVFEPADGLAPSRAVSSTIVPRRR